MSSDATGVVIAAFCAFCAAAHQRTDLLLGVILRLTQRSTRTYPVCWRDVPNVCPLHVTARLACRFYKLPLFKYACSVGGANLFRAGYNDITSTAWAAGEDYVLPMVQATTMMHRTWTIEDALVRRFSRVMDYCEREALVRGDEIMLRVARAYLYGDMDGGDEDVCMPGFVGEFGVGATTLVALMAGGHTEKALAFVQQSSERVNACGFHGKTPLEYALHLGCSDIVRALLADARLNVDRAKRFSFLLLAAAIRGGTIALLLDCGRFHWSPDEVTDAILHACNSDALDALRAILAHSLAEPLLVDGRFLLRVVAEKCSPRCLRAILECDQLYMTADDNGQTALHFAARHGRMDLYAVLCGDARVEHSHCDEWGLAAHDYNDRLRGDLDDEPPGAHWE